MLIAVFALAGGERGGTEDLQVPPGHYVVTENGETTFVSIESSRRWVTRTDGPHGEDLTVFVDGVTYVTDPVNRVVLVDQSSDPSVPVYPILDGRYLNALRNGRIGDEKTAVSFSAESIATRAGFISVPRTLTVRSSTPRGEFDDQIVVDVYSPTISESVDEALERLSAEGWEFVELSDLPRPEESLQEGSSKSVAVALAAQYIEQDAHLFAGLEDDSSPAPSIEITADALWLMAVEVCGDRFPDDVIEEGPPFSNSYVEGGLSMLLPVRLRGENLGGRVVM